MGQLIRIDPLSEEERRQKIEKQKRILRYVTSVEEYRNIFESGDDKYMWLDHYRKQRERQRWIKELGYDPASGEDPFPHTPV